MSAKGKLALFSIVLFLVGGSLGFIGGFYYHTYKTHRMWARLMKTNPKTMQLDTFTRELNLTPEQRKGMDAILEKQFQGFKALWEETKPRYDALGDSSRTAIINLLTPEQKIKYDSLLARWKKKIPQCDKK
jgi:Spy/CpxP family protein refolding chaperone